MTPRRGSQRASFGLHARGNEECRADTIGLAPVGRPQSLVDMLLCTSVPSFFSMMQVSQTVWRLLTQGPASRMKLPPRSSANDT